MKIGCLLLLILFYSCTDADRSKNIILSAIPEKTDSIRGIQIPITELIPTGIYRVDTFLVIQNLEEEKFLKIYSANTFRFLGALLDKGRGPNEVLNCRLMGGDFKQEGAALQIRAARNHFWGVMDLGLSLREDSVRWKEKFDFMKDRKAEYLYSSLYYLGDSVFIVSRAIESYAVSTSGYIKEADGAVRMISNKGTVEYPALNPFWIKYDYKNSSCSDTFWYSDYKDLSDYLRVRSSSQDMSPDKQKIAVAYHLMNQVLLVNLSTKQKKLVTTEAELPVPYNTGEGYKYFYSGLCCTDNRVFAVNAFSTDPRMNTNAKNFIHVFDWDGNFKYMLNAAHPLKYPYLDAEKGHLYAMDEEDNILLYDISRFL